MICTSCGSTRIAEVLSKSSDHNDICINGIYNSNGYVPKDIGIGGGDYIEFDYCLDCGKILGSFPIKKIDMEV